MKPDSSATTNSNDNDREGSSSDGVRNENDVDRGSQSDVNMSSISTNINVGKPAISTNGVGDNDERDRRDRREEKGATTVTINTHGSVTQTNQDLLSMKTIKIKALHATLLRDWFQNKGLVKQKRVRYQSHERNNDITYPPHFFYSDNNNDNDKYKGANRRQEFIDDIVFIRADGMIAGANEESGGEQ